MTNWRIWSLPKKSNSNPVFCKYCGEKLEPNKAIAGYDEYTGKPVQPFLNQMICTNRFCDGKFPNNGYGG